MEIHPIQMALAIAIVFVSAAIAIGKIIDSRAEAQRIANSSLATRPRDKKETQIKGSLNALVPGIEEAAKCKNPSHAEALLVEQLGFRITLSGINLNNVSSQVAEFQNIKSQAKKKCYCR